MLLSDLVESLQLIQRILLPRRSDRLVSGTIIRGADGESTVDCQKELD
jgi:hypothetical protein